jgi:hypothetical protein
VGRAFSGVAAPPSAACSARSCFALGITLPTTLSLPEGWNYLFIGGLTLIALAIYTQGVGAAIVLRAKTLSRSIGSVVGSSGRTGAA